MNEPVLVPISRTVLDDAPRGLHDSMRKLLMRPEPNGKRHRIQLSIIDGQLRATGWWCPGRHGGHCDAPELEEMDAPACHGEHGATDEICEPCYDYEESGGYVENGECFVCHSLDHYLDHTSLEEAIAGSAWVALPWMEFDLDGPGPDGNDPIDIKLIPMPVVEQWPTTDDTDEGDD